VTFFCRSSCIYLVARLLCYCSTEKSHMLMPIATYSFFPKAGWVAAHLRGLDVATPGDNVTLAERHAR
jgi:hypothetical protein